MVTPSQHLAEHDLPMSDADSSNLDCPHASYNGQATREFVITQQSARKSNNIETHDEEDSAAGGQSTGAQPIRMKSFSAAILVILNRYPSEYPTEQNMDECSRLTGLNRKQLNDYFSRRRQMYLRMCHVSNRATEGEGSMRQRTLTEQSSNCSDKGRNRDDLDDISDSFASDGYPYLLRAPYQSRKLDWWFDTLLRGVASQFPERDTLKDLHPLRHNFSRAASDNSLLLLSDTGSSWDMCSIESGSLSLSGSSNIVSTRRQGKRVCPGSRSSNVSTLGSQSTDVMFFCTLGHDFASTNCDSWRRHEREQHAQPALWICEPTMSNTCGKPECSFCGQDLTAGSCVHDVQKCTSKH